MSQLSRQASIRRHKQSAAELFTQTGRELGRGAYGQIFEVEYEGSLCAAKKLHPALFNKDELQKIKENFIKACRTWKSLCDPHIVQLMKVCNDPVMGRSALPVIVMEKMQLSLRGLVEKYDNIPLFAKTSILNDVCLGLRYLHSHNPPIVHQDLTPNNVLLTCNLKAKISDMGVAKVLQRDTKTTTEVSGTVDFMPPESLTKKPCHEPSSDVFSFGAIVLYTITQMWPKPAKINSERKSMSEVERRQDYITKMTGGAANLQSLVVKCLDNDPTERPTIVEVSATIKKCATEKRMGKPTEWWVDAPSGCRPMEHRNQTCNNLPKSSSYPLIDKLVL